MDGVVQVMEKSNSVQEKLKELYKQLTIPRAAWMESGMESGMDLPLQDFYVELKLELLGQPISQNQIFDDVTAKRILIEGLPGHGKTTLVTKIAYDWAVNEEYTQRFQLVFFLAIRGLKRDVDGKVIDVSVVDGIVDLVDDSQYNNPEEIREMIKREEDKILLILDGLDEATQSTRDNILRILYKKEMKRMTVIVTCRTEEFNLQPEEDRILFKGISRKRSFSDRRITVLGVANECKELFLEKFLKGKETTINKVKKYLANISKQMEEVFRSPLMLILLADIMLRDKVIGSISSVTSFLKFAINFMIRRSQERNGVILKDSFNVFEARNEENGSYKFQLRRFSYLCFQHNWRSSNLEFDDSEPTRSVHKMGLLIKGKRLTLASCTNHFQIYHRTFLEFLAAYHIWDEFVMNNFIFPSNCEEKLVEDIVYFASTSMVRPFLIELMKEKAETYFQLMTKHNILQRKLKEFYKRLLIPQIMYMDQRPDLPIQSFFVELTLRTDKDRVITRDQILDEGVITRRNILLYKISRNKNKRILVEGPPGYGKTTFVTKIAHDWAVNEPYTQQFDFVFLLPIREFQDQSIMKAIVTLVSISGYYEPDQVRKEIENKQSKILLILDGWEDASPIVLQDFLQSRSNELQMMTIIVTCQSKVMSQQFFQEEMFFQEPFRIPFFKSFDRTISVLGITEENRLTFLKNILHEEQLLDSLQNVITKNEDFFQSPLALSILCEIVNKGLIPTMTNICKEVINSLIRRSEEKRNNFLTNSFNIFDSDNDQNYSFFTLEQFTHNAHEIYRKFQDACETFQRLLRNKLTFSKEVEHKLITDVVYNGTTSMVTPFLIGLMKEKASSYFILMSVHDYLFQKYQLPLWRMLKECECVEAIAPQLAPIIPTQFSCLDPTDLNDSHSHNLYNQLVKIKSQSGLMTPYYVNNDTKLRLPTGIELPEVHLYPSGQSCRRINEMVKGIRCNSCHLHCDPNDDQLFFTEYYQLFTNISSQEYVFNCCNKSAIFLLNKIDEWTDKMKINRVVYDYVNNSSPEDEKHSVLEAISTLINKCQIKHLIFKLKTDEEINQLLTYRQKVDRLTFAYDDTKDIKKFFIDAENSSSVSSRLKCNAHTLLHDTNVCPGISCETITELVLLFSHNAYSDELWKIIRLMRNLKSLTLTDLPIEAENFKSHLIPNVFQLSIDKLQVTMKHTSFLDKFLQDVFTYLQSVTQVGPKTFAIDIISLKATVSSISIAMCQRIIKYCHKQTMNLQNVEILFQEESKDFFKYIETSDRDTAIKYSFDTSLPRVSEYTNLRLNTDSRIKMIITANS